MGVMTDPAPDSVTQDAINAKAPVPPMEWSQAQRRAFLGGVFGYRNGATANPYSDPECNHAWNKGWERERKEAARAR